MYLDSRQLTIHVCFFDAKLKRHLVLCSAGGRAAGIGPADHPGSEEEEALGAAAGLTLLAHALADTAALLGVRMAPFACGPVAMALGRGS
jgi:hypothetical protein